MDKTQLKVGFYRLLMLFYILIIPMIHAQNDQGQASSQITSALSGIQSFPEQFAMGFGFCPSEYTYSMQVWNDLNVPLEALLQSVVSVQGAKFNSTTKASHTLAPYQATRSGDFSQVHLCHAIVRLQAQSLISPSGLKFYEGIFERPIDIDKTDKNTYYYHAFTLNGNSHGEFLGPGLYGGPYTNTSAFDGVFFNNTPIDVQLEFTKTVAGTDHTYKVTLESDSFSMVSSGTTQEDSIRGITPRAFTFTMPHTTVTLPIASQGWGQVFQDPVAKTSVSVPLTNTYEIYGDAKTGIKVGIQGFNMGNYNQRGMRSISASKPPQSLAKMRDINPVACSLWYQSAAQYQKSLAHNNSTSSSMMPYDSDEQVWVVYTSKDYSLQQQVLLGTAPSFLLIRPTASEGTRQLYVFAVATSDTAKAQQFLSNITQDPGFLPRFLKTGLADPTSMNTNDIARAVTQALSTPSSGLITDRKTGLTAYLLLTDAVVAYAGGEETPRFYEITPPLLEVDSNFASIITSYLDPTLFSGGSQQAISEFRQNIASWLTQFSKAKSTLTNSTLLNVDSFASQLQDAVPELTSYLRSKGVQTLFSNPSSSADQRTFNSRGIRALYFILLGPISLKNPPLLRQAGTNAYLIGKKPSDWPST